MRCSSGATSLDCPDKPSNDGVSRESGDLHQAPKRKPSLPGSSGQSSFLCPPRKLQPPPCLPASLPSTGRERMSRSRSVSLPLAGRGQGWGYAAPAANTVGFSGRAPDDGCEGRWNSSATSLDCPDKPGNDGVGRESGDLQQVPKVKPSLPGSSGQSSFLCDRASCNPHPCCRLPSPQGGGSA
jgi:hypothetical protein